MKIRFMSTNEYKIREVRNILSEMGHEIVPVEDKINEIQTENSHELVFDKALKAFKKIGRPLFVEHTGLYIEYLNGLPGGLTQIFWDNLKADKFCKLFGNNSNINAIAKTTIGYIDSKDFSKFEGEIRGTISKEPRGCREFQWDCVFIPEEYDKTFSELGEEKNKISMRKKAIQKFSEYLKEQANV